MTKFSITFQKFLNLTHVVDVSKDFSELTANERYLIKCLNNYWIKNENITVVSAMKINRKISTSTTFRLLKSLRKQGFISLEIDKIDNRIKYIKPTDKIQSLFHQYGKILMKVADDNS